MSNTSSTSAIETSSFTRSGMQTVTTEEVKIALGELIDDFVDHNGHATCTVDVTWHRKGQKLVTIKAGKELRFLIPAKGASA